MKACFFIARGLLVGCQRLLLMKRKEMSKPELFMMGERDGEDLKIVMLSFFL